MNASFLSEAMRRNWHLALILIVCVAGAIVYSSMRSDGDASTAPSSATADPATTQAAPTGKRLTPAEEAEQTIAHHQAELAVDPQSEQAPALLLSIGNLYMQKVQDYDQAISHYERLIHDYPEWDGLRKAYVQLASAYEKDGQVAKAQSVYHDMLRQFPPDSVEYDYAQQRLKSAVTGE